MSNRLYRSRTDRFLGGVCGGLGKYLAIDPTIVRLIFLILLFTHGIGVGIYLILWFLLPVEGGAETTSGDIGDRIGEGMKNVGEDILEVTQTPHPKAGLWIGAGLIVLGAILFAERVADMLGLGWLSSWISWSTLWPILIIILGAALILRGTRKGE
jgi:phage shock protein C